MPPKGSKRKSIVDAAVPAPDTKARRKTTGNEGVAALVIAIVAPVVAVVPTRLFSCGINCFGQLGISSEVP